MPEPLHLKIFISSPGDVAEERELARALIKSELPYDPLLRSRVTFEVLTWDDPDAGVPLLATMTPQEAVNQGLGRPADCDITVVILWSRFGTPLDPKAFRKPDGTTYLSGTEWEYQDARAAGREILVYHRAARVLLDVEAIDFDERREQSRRVKEFLANFRNQDGSYNGSFKTYESPEELKKKIENDLKVLINARLNLTQQMELHNRPLAPSEQDTLLIAAKVIEERSAEPNEKLDRLFDDAEQMLKMMKKWEGDGLVDKSTKVNGEARIIDYCITTVLRRN